MIKHWLITGDTHGQVADRLHKIKTTMPDYAPEETAVIILGDVGLNYYLDKKDHRQKWMAEEYGYTIYCVHGNHEERASNIKTMKFRNDSNVGGPVYYEEEFPNIRYFCDWGIYMIDGRKTLVIGGAYSVDKHYRIQNGWQWFESEQLNDWEMGSCGRSVAAYPRFDLVLSHTCPKSLQPTDLFLGCIDQSSVDSTMEVWMDGLENQMDYNLWLWGHYHGDRIEAPHCEMFYYEVEDLKTIEERWRRYDETGELDWWLPVSPSMKRLMERE
jgi:3-oxoacid CoA-transferase subunit A